MLSQHLFLTCISLSSQIATVDKYQGQQNDIILLSLVRTRAVGHLRDVRRLVVAMSRARYGTYVFGRAKLFGNCYELQPTMKLLLERPTQLALLPDERYGVWLLLFCGWGLGLCWSGGNRVLRVEFGIMLSGLLFW